MKYTSTGWTIFVEREREEFKKKPQPVAYIFIIWGETKEVNSESKGKKRLQSLEIATKESSCNCLEVQKAGSNLDFYKL